MTLSHLRNTAALALLALGAQPVAAIPLSGTFAQDNDVQFFTFTLSSAANVTIATDSFAAGGFEPGLYLWNSYGSFVDQGDNIGVPGTSDSTIAISLAAGTYYFALALSDNSLFALDMPGANPPTTNFADIYTASVFFYSGGVSTDPQFMLNQVNITCSGDPALTSNYFVYEISGCENRTGAWSLNINADIPSALGGVSLYPAVVPEPATLTLALAGLAGIAPFARRRTG